MQQTNIGDSSTGARAWRPVLNAGSLWNQRYRPFRLQNAFAGTAAALAILRLLDGTHAVAAPPAAPSDVRNGWANDWRELLEDGVVWFYGGMEWSNNDPGNVTRFNLWFSTNQTDWVVHNTETRPESLTNTVGSVPFKQIAATKGYWKVEAKNNDGSSWSDDYKFVALAPPSRINSESQGANQTTLTWKQVSKTQTGSTLHRSTNAFATFTEIPLENNESVFVDNFAFAAGVVYAYRILPYCDTGKGSFTSETNCIAPNAPPVAPFRCTFSTISPSTSVEIRWATMLGTQKGYRIDRKQGDGDWTNGVYSKGITGEQAWTDTGCNRGALYTYRICATNDAGDSPFLTNVVAIPSRPPGNTTVFYIDNAATGSSYAGDSWSIAWRSVNSVAWDYLKPGDTVYISGGTKGKVYPEAFYASSSGSTGAPITFKTATNSPHNGRVSLRELVRFRTQNWITLDGSKAPAFTLPAPQPNLSHLYAITNNINLDISNPTGPGVWGDAFTGNKVLWAEIHHCGSPTNSPQADGIAVSGAQGTVGGEIGWCWVHHNWKDGVSMSINNPTNYGGIVTHHCVIEWNGDDNVVIGGHGGCDLHDCVVHDVAQGLGSGHPDGLELYEGWMRIYNNWIYNTKTSYLNWGVKRTPAGNLRIYNNIIGGGSYDTTDAGVNYGAQDTDTVFTEDVLFANNLFFCSFRFSKKNMNDLTFTNIVVMNNIYYAMESCGSDHALPQLAGGLTGGYQWDSRGLRFEHNVVAGACTQVRYGGVNYPDVASLAMGTGWRGNNNITPVFTSAANRDCRPVPGDAATVGRGVDLSTYEDTAPGITKDILGNPRIGPWTIGPYQRGGSNGGTVPVRPSGVRTYGTEPD